MSTDQKVRDHFQADASRFDAIYEDAGKGPFARFVDDVWRGVVKQRLKLALRELQPAEGRRFLDVGCGSGRFCLEYAARGASHVLGVDVAPAMIEIANQLARERGLSERCVYRTGRFPDDVPETGYDYASAIGYFDYVADPVEHLVALRERTTRRIIMSFPKRWEWRVPLRRLRFWRSGCPLYLYTAGDVRRLLGKAGLTRCDWIGTDRDYVVVARLD
ncbi:MAG TPA: methyltransferase domain-containing protein [Candidatus Eisenbacteria bacterium]|jgi:SAM-dependent methyltransferase